MAMEMDEDQFRKSPKIATKNTSSSKVKLLKLLQFSVLNSLSCWDDDDAMVIYIFQCFQGKRTAPWLLTLEVVRRQRTMCLLGLYIRLRAIQVKLIVLPMCRVYEQPLLLQPDPNTLILEGHIHANPKPKVGPSTYSSSNSRRTLSVFHAASDSFFLLFSFSTILPTLLLPSVTPCLIR